MIKINGNDLIKGDIILDERYLTNNKCRHRKYDRREFENENDVDKIVIDSTMGDINILSTNSNKIEIHFYGSINIDGDFILEVETINRELKIFLRFIGNYYIGNLKLDIAVPKKNFNEIFVKSAYTNIKLEKGVSAEKLKVQTQSGKLNINASFSKASIITESGDVELYTDANENISTQISTMSGDVSVEFKNIGNIDFCGNSMSGTVNNYHNNQIGYNANVNISTMSGDISIK